MKEQVDRQVPAIIVPLSLEELGDESEDPRGGPEEIVLRQETRELLIRAIRGLSEKERRMLGLFYGGGWNQQDISRMMHLSPARISQIHQRALRRLRGHFGREQRRTLAAPSRR